MAVLALFARSGGRIDVWVTLVSGYGLLLVLAQIRLMPLYLRLSFAPSFWSFAFSWSAVAAVTLRWITGGGSCRRPRRRPPDSSARRGNTYRR